MKIGQNGPILNSSGIVSLLDHVIGGQGPYMPVCIWGDHGLGKTQLVKSYAESRGWHFAYAAAAQFEELGDLHGCPIIVEKEGSPGPRQCKIFSYSHGRCNAYQVIPLRTRTMCKSLAGLGILQQD